MEMITSRYIPALSFRWLTPLYDPLLRWGMREEVFKGRLIVRAGIQAGQEVLDVGCGTGTLSLMIKRAVPGARVTGVDGDPRVLSIARRKAAQSNLHVQWDEGMAYDLPYPDNAFDVVVSSLVIHHLVTTDKLRAFREVRRVLRPRGTFHIVDFGRPFSVTTCLQSTIMKRLEQAGDNFDGRLLPMLRDSGFTRAQETEPMNTVFGPIWFYEAANANT